MDPMSIAQVASLAHSAEAGSYLRLIDFFITQLKAQELSMFRNESKEERRRSSSVPKAGEPLYFGLGRLLQGLQGYLAHEKPPTLQGPPKDPRHRHPVRS